MRVRTNGLNTPWGYADIAAAAEHYLGADAPAFVEGIEQALAAGRRWASFELEPTTVTARSQTLG